MPRFTPTDEQKEVLRKFGLCRPLKVGAFAGTGKTSTLTLLAESRRSRGLYLAFNKSIADEARHKFPRTVDCRTTHSIAWRAVKGSFRFSDTKMKSAIRPKQLAETLQLKDRVFGQTIRLNGVHQAFLILRTLRSYCQSADLEIRRAHIPQYGRLLGAREEVLTTVQDFALTQSDALWKRMTDHRDAIPLGHDGYLKLWALGRPRLEMDFILLDEAQDTNPVVLGVLGDQVSQIVYVGDRHQQIYEWRGAVNAMEKIEGCEEAYLTQSFRFGAPIAEAASQVLGTLGETRALVGNAAVRSRITGEQHAGTILARTNATVMLEVLGALTAGLKPHVIGGIEELKRLLSDVFELKEGKPAVSPEFFGFQNWAEVVAFAETEEGEDLRMFVQLVEQHGERRLWAALKNAHDDEKSADVIVSTAHKAKGREWDSVRLAPDFLNSRLAAGNPNAEAEVRLFYVAMTRARGLLSVDPGVLATFTSGAWRTREPERAPASPVRPAPTDRRLEPREPPRPKPEAPAVVFPAGRNGGEAARQPQATPAAPQRPRVEAVARTPERPSFWRRVSRMFVG